MEEKKGWASWSTTKRTLIVIGAGVGFSFAVCLAAFAYGIYWLYGAGDQADTQVAIGPTSVGYVRWVAAEDDPGIEDLLRRIAGSLSKLQHQRREDMPAPLRAMMELQSSQQADSFRIFWPRAVTVSFEEEDRFLLALNLRGMGGMVKSMFAMMTSDMMQEGGEMGLRPIEHREHQIMVPTSTTSNLSFALLGSTILVGEQQDLQATIDRALDAVPATPNARLQSMEKMVAAQSDFYLVYQEPPELGQADVGVGLDIVEADRWQAVAVARATSLEHVASVAQAGEARLDALRTEMAEHGIGVEAHRSDVDPRTLRWDITITNVAVALERDMLEELEQAP